MTVATNAVVAAVAQPQLLAERCLHADIGSRAWEARARAPRASFERIVRDSGWGPSAFMTKRLPDASPAARDRVDTPLRFLLSTHDTRR